MSPTIRISDAVYEALKAHAEPFVDTPDSVLRRILGLGSAGTNGAGTSDELDAVQPEIPPAQRNAHVTNRPPGAPRASRATRPRQSRAPKGSLLAAEAYELAILRVLTERGGRAPTSEVLDALEPLLADQLTKLDREPTSSGEIRWRNRAQFARLHLVEQGDMNRDSARGVWEITEQGEHRARAGSR